MASIAGAAGHVAPFDILSIQRSILSMTECVPSCDPRRSLLYLMSPSLLFTNRFLLARGAGLHDSKDRRDGSLRHDAINTVTADGTIVILTTTAGGSTILLTTTFAQTFTASGPTVTYTSSQPAVTFTTISEGSTVYFTSTLQGETVTSYAPAQTVVQTYTSLLPGATETTTIQQVSTQYSTFPGGTQTITGTTVPDGSTSFIERTITAPAQTSTIEVTQPGGTVTQTKEGETYYVTATTTIPAVSIFYVNGGYSSAPGQTVTVAYCPYYPGMKFARQDSGDFVYQHCDC
jgi:hypothetical protein